MGDIGTPISSGSIPAVGTSGTTYASDINLFLTEVKARLEAKVPRTSLASGDLDLNGESLQNAEYVGLTTQAGAPTTPVGSLQRFNNNLYWINNGGAVQITSGTTLNTTLVGGITGDYGGANPAQFRFVDADQEYYAYDDYAGGAWARVWARNFDIANGATGSIRARLAFGGGSSYTMTLPPAVPGSTVAVQMSSAGALSVSNTFSGNLTAADFRYTNGRVARFNAGLMGEQIGGSAHTRGQSSWVLGNSTTVSITIPIVVETGVTMTSWEVNLNKATTATIRARMFKTDYTTGTSTQVGTNQTVALTGFQTLQENITQVASATEYYWIDVLCTAGDPSGDNVYCAAVQYHRT